jgi:hypothetical protein
MMIVMKAEGFGVQEMKYSTQIKSRKFRMQSFLCLTCLRLSASACG